MHSPLTLLFMAQAVLATPSWSSWSAWSSHSSPNASIPITGMTSDASSMVGASSGAAGTGSAVGASSGAAGTSGAGSATAVSLLSSASSAAASGTSTAAGATYTNPVLNVEGADPWVIRDGDYYYMTFSLNNNITLYRSKTLTDWNNADQKLLFLPPPGEDYSTDIWAPEIHFLDGLWYVIFTADPHGDSPSPQVSQYCDFDCPAFYHRMYTLESSSSDIWASTYTFKSQLNTFDQFAIDGTYLVYPPTSSPSSPSLVTTSSTSSLYHIYSCWYSTYTSWPANLCITTLSNPSTVSSNLTQRTIISVPTEPWEQTPYGRAITGNVRLASNEGPQQLVSPVTGQTFVVYSAARSDNANYCLGLLALKIGGDPMNQQDWTKSDGCVFYQNKLEGAYGVGHASFVQSPDGSEWFIVYHGMADPTNGWSARTIRTQKFTWDAVSGYPVFPRPGYGPYAVPSGQ